MSMMPARKSDKVTYLPKAGRPAGRRKLRLSSCLLLGILIYLSALFVTQNIRLLQLNSTLSELEKEIEIIKSQNEEMLSEIDRLHAPAYLEQIARQELGMVKPGEMLFFFSDR